MSEPREPIEFASTNVVSKVSTNPLSNEVLSRLSRICATSTTREELIRHSRDWWPLAMHWALRSETLSLPDVVCSPMKTTEVSGIVMLCAELSIAITPMGGRSSVTGAAAPTRGGVALDMTRMNGLIDVDVESGVVCVEAGMFGPDLESALNTEHDLTVGHFPQSFEISTVGGWVASRGAGQFSTRYGKIEDMVVGLEVVLADGRVVQIGPTPAAASGPDLLQMFLGSEGTLGVITKVWLRAHPSPESRRIAAFSFSDVRSGLDAMRGAVRNGATPAVLRLYDEIESARSHAAVDSRCVLLVLDEGATAMVDATMEMVRDSCVANGGATEDDRLVDAWLEHRNDVSALAALTHKGFVIDTMEVTARWSQLIEVIDAVKRAASKVDGMRNASVHVSHSYLDGACLYFTFAAKTSAPEHTYRELWDAAQRAALASGSNLSHHHGVGVNRARFMDESLGGQMAILRSIKEALDPDDIMNPGKLGLSESPWP